MNSRVLIVEDEVISALYLSMFLSDEGFEVQVAHSAHAALEIAEDFKPEILLTDWMLKDGMDGIDIARILSSKSPGLYTIFMTGMAMHNIAHKTSDIPNASILEKPFEPESMLDQIRSGLKTDPEA